MFLSITNNHYEFVSIISCFLNGLTATDQKLINNKSIKTDLKLIFCKLLFGYDVYKNCDVEDYKKFIIGCATISGYLKTLRELYDGCGFSAPDSGYKGVAPYMEAIDWVYEEHGGNMVEIGWIENNKLLEIVFLD